MTIIKQGLVIHNSLHIFER